MKHLACVLLMVIRWHKIPAKVLEQGFHETIKQGEPELEETVYTIAGHAN